MNVLRVEGSKIMNAVDEILIKSSEKFIQKGNVKAVYRFCRNKDIARMERNGRV